MFRSLFVFAVLFLAPLSLSAQTMYVNATSADLKTGTTAAASVIKQLRRGTAVNVLARSGNWIQVSTNGQSGWVYKYKLSINQPTSEGSGFLVGLGGGGATAREGSTATSIRGLSPTSEKYAGRAKIGKDQIKMVKHMEDGQLPKKEVRAFLKDGKLGEYAE